MKPKNVIIDCDTGVDDALALLLALRSPTLNILGITTVAGNVPIEKVVRNTLVVIEQSGKTVPVYQGARKALIGKGKTAEYAHGTDGLGDIGFPDPTMTKSSQHAIDFLINTFLQSEKPIDLITLGPLTNIAMALQKAPSIGSRINSIVMMAGGINYGNYTAAAEFNIWVDPEAADIVFRSDIPEKTMVSLEPNHQGGQIYLEDVELIENADTLWCNMAGKLMRSQMALWSNLTGDIQPLTPPDLTAMGVAICPNMAKAECLPAVIETAGKYTRGMTLIDKRPVRHIRPEKDFNELNIVFSIDNTVHRKLVLDTLLG